MTLPNASNSAQLDAEELLHLRELMIHRANYEELSIVLRPFACDRCREIAHKLGLTNRDGVVRGE